MIILGIETSCDETGAAIVQDGTKLIAQSLSSSISVQEKYKGIVPDQAAREQLESILPVIHDVLTTSQILLTSIDAIAVTVGPGLIGSLLVGVETAKTLALAWNKPLVPVNHLIAHIYANWILENSAVNLPQFPAIVLLVSGGHSELILMHNHQKFELLGSTRDDAAGECFDKCGRLLDLPYPYGPYIQTEAEKFVADSAELVVNFPRPLSDSQNFDFSFSGLKTAFLNKYNELRASNYKFLVPHLAYELQESITDILVKKTVRAVKKYKPRSVLLAGGVAANKRLREKLQSTMNREFGSTVNLHIPPISLCTDNAINIASAAFFNYHPQKIETVSAQPGLHLND